MNPRKKMIKGLKFWEPKKDNVVIEQPQNKAEVKEDKLDYELLAASKIANSELDFLESQIAELTGHYSTYLKTLVMGNLKSVEGDISSTLTSIYTSAKEIKNILEERDLDPEIMLKFKSLWVVLWDAKEEHKLAKLNYVNGYMQAKFPNVKSENINNLSGKIVDAVCLSDNQVFAEYLKYYDVLNYVEYRHKKMLHLEDSITEVHQLFIDAWVLVQEQSYTIEKIRKDMQSARKMVNDSKVVLSDAHQSAHRPSFYKAI